MVDQSLMPYDDGMVKLAFAIADKTALVDIFSHCLTVRKSADNPDELFWRMADDDHRPVDSVSEASLPIRNAVLWLEKRQLARVTEVPALGVVIEVNEEIDTTEIDLAAL